MHIGKHNLRQWIQKSVVWIVIMKNIVLWRNINTETFLAMSSLNFSTWNFAINGMVTFLTFIIAVCRIMTIVVIITLNRFTLNLIFTSLVSPRDHDPTAVSWNKYVNIDEREKFMWKTHNIQFIFIRSGPYTSKNNRDPVECILRITVGNSWYSS